MRIAIIHPWLPQYRVAFFNRLVSAAAQHGLEVDVFYGDPSPEWEKRGDVGATEGFVYLPTRFFSVRGRALNWKCLRPLRKRGPYELVVLEQAVRNLETYGLICGRTPLAFWGHGSTATKHVGRLQEKLKQWVSLQGKWFFAYTQGGADAMMKAGMPQNRMTVVQNSIDTAQLHADIASVRRQDLESFRLQYDLRNRTALFIGGLDDSKRIPFLLEAADLAWQLDSSFRLLIAGSGEDSFLVEQAARSRKHISYLGPLFGADKALAMAAADVLAMPGRVGLVAVDSFAASTPIVTTDWEWHSVEIEYLESRENAIITPNSLESYAYGLATTLADPSLMSHLRGGCVRAKEQYTLEAMVENFLDGLLQACKGKGRRS